MLPKRTTRRTKQVLNNLAKGRTSFHSPQTFTLAMLIGPGTLYDTRIAPIFNLRSRIVRFCYQRLNSFGGMWHIESNVCSWHFEDSRTAGNLEVSLFR
jgi:hypothetical protein